MKILIKSKNKIAPQVISGNITSSNFARYLNMTIIYSTHPKFFTELQKFLLKYYNLEIQSGGKVKNRLILKKLKKEYKTKRYGLSWIKAK